jgi:hypothetical protein
MNIYIDESGIFRNPSQKSNIASVVAALIIPTSQRAEIVKEFRKLTRGWKPKGEEIKGKELNEAQIAAIVNLLKKYPVCVEAKVIDLALITEDEVTILKEGQANNVTANLKPTHHPNIVKQTNEIREAFLNMSNPLFIQAFLMMMLIIELVPKMKHYYARRIPEELGKFHWVVDAKDKKLTEFEKAWSLAVYPIMSTQSFREPFAPIEGGDYSYFERYNDSQINNNEEELDALMEFAGLKTEENMGKKISATSLKKLLGESFKFEDSKKNTGLQLVDIIVNAIQRALNGKLQKSGWKDIGSLMIAKNPHPLDLVSFNTGTEKAGTKTVTSPFFGVFETFTRNAKSLWTRADGLDFERMDAIEKSAKNI